MLLIHRWFVLAIVALLVSLAACHEGAPPPDASQLQPAGLTVPAQSEAFSEADARSWLVRLSSTTPEERLTFAVGPAREVLAQENEFVAEGWPRGSMNQWMQEAWKTFEVSQGPDGTASVSLTHATSLDSSSTRFKFVWVGQWRLVQIGDGYAWYAPFPKTIPGQEGDLTERLALEIVDHALSYYGAPRMRTSTTGREAERGRLLAIAVIAGASLRPQAWGGVGPRLRLRQEAQNRVIGYWLDDQGQPTGERVLFERENGLWKLADHTEGGEWAPARRTGFDLPRGVSSDMYLLGLDWPMNEAGVRKLAGPPDQVTDATWIYRSRGLAVTFDEKGRVRRIAARSGATMRGVMVGDSLQTVRSLYGDPEPLGNGWIGYREGRQLRFRMQPDADGEERVMEIVLEWNG